MEQLSRFAEKMIYNQNFNLIFDFIVEGPQEAPQASPPYVS
jgi:hypothetical protein